MSSYRQTLQTLYDALAREVYEATIGDQTVKYASKAELLKAIQKFESLAAQEERAANGYYAGDGHRVRAVAGSRYI